MTSKDHLNVMQDPRPKNGILDCIKWVRVVEYEFVLLLTLFATGPAVSGLYYWDLPTEGPAADSLSACIRILCACTHFTFQTAQI